MANYLCAVSGRFPENYEIGLRASTWGVEEKYESKIRQAHPGDRLVFVVGGLVRSIHLIESEPYFDKAPLWPSKDGSWFPHRIKISDAVSSGEAPLKDIADEISFMKDKERWGGAIQGPNGVFNSRLTDADIQLLTSRMMPGARFRPRRPVEIDQKARERQKALFRFYERDVEDRIEQLLPDLRLRIYKDPQTLRSGRQYVCEAGRIDLLCQDNRGDYVVIELKKGEAPNETLLQILRYMSWVRQNLVGDGQKVRGIILTESADSGLVDILGEVPNVSIEYYRVSLELVK